MKAYIYIIRLFVVAGALLVTSCFDDPGTDTVWGGESFIELDRAGQASPVVSKVFDRLNDGTTFPLDVQVNVMGLPQSTAVNVTFEIDPASTAVAGVHYNKLTSGNTLTIPAGASLANIAFEVLSDNINTGEVWTLIIKITGGDLPLSNYVMATWQLRITCPFPGRSFFTGSYMADEPGYDIYPATLTTDATNPNGIRTNNFWDFGGNLLYVLDAATNKVTIPTQTIQMGGEGWIISQGAAGDGTFDPCTGTMVIPYKVVRVSDGGTYDNNTHTYTKN
jgi:hypothetical protein